MWFHLLHQFDWLEISHNAPVQSVFSQSSRCTESRCAYEVNSEMQRRFGSVHGPSSSHQRCRSKPKHHFVFPAWTDLQKTTPWAGTRTNTSLNHTDFLCSYDCFRLFSLQLRWFLFAFGHFMSLTHLIVSLYRGTGPRVAGPGCRGQQNSVS